IKSYGPTRQSAYIANYRLLITKTSRNDCQEPKLSTCALRADLRRRIPTTPSSRHPTDEWLGLTAVSSYIWGNPKHRYYSVLVVRSEIHPIPVNPRVHFRRQLPALICGNFAFRVHRVDDHHELALGRVNNPSFYTYVFVTLIFEYKICVLRSDRVTI